MKFNKTIVGSVIAAALVLGGVTTALRIQSQQTEQKNQAADAKQAKAAALHRTDITYTAKAGITSLDQLKTESKDVVTKQSTYGEYVDSIEGSVGGTNGKYWSFYVNGTMSEVGAGTYIQKGGEQIEWKFQKL